jgi:acyl carrier protein
MIMDSAALERVQSAICERPEVTDAFVYRTGQAADGECRAILSLNSYYTAPDLREYLSARLGEDKIPEVVVIVPEIPRDSAGNVTVESAELLTCSPDASVSRFVTTRTTTEKSLARLWREVLARELIGTEDKFADLGGDSIAAMLLLSMVEEELGVVVPLARFLDEPSVSGLAAAVDDLGGRRPCSR